MLLGAAQSGSSHPSTTTFESLECRRLLSAPTDLDPSFSGDGKVITDFGGANDIAHAVAVQSDGKIVVAGETQVTVKGVKETAFAVVRYNPDGSQDDGSSKDTTKRDKFGTGGKFVRVLDQGGGTGAVAIAIQKDGKIILAGNSIKSSTVHPWDFLRLNKDGTLDSSYGTKGVHSDNFTAAVAPQLTSIILQPDGKLVAAGGIEGEWHVERLTTTGQIDNTFNNGVGQNSFDFGGVELATALALDNLGRIVIAGDIRGNSAIGLGRMNSDGTDDNSFGTNGRTEFDDPAGASDHAGAMLVLPNGQIRVAIDAIDSVTHAHSDGPFSFDENGKFASAGNNTGESSINGLANTPIDGGLFGGTSISGPAPETFYLSAGSGDSLVNFGSKTDHNVASAMAVGPDGKIVQVGYTTAGGGGHNFAIARYVGTPTKGLGTITGNVFLDNDGDGVRDPNDPPQIDRRVFIDSNNNSVFDPLERSVLTDINGSYQLFVAPGTYSIRQVLPNMGTATLPLATPNLYTLTVAAKQTLNGIDFGDAPMTPPPPGRITGSVFFDFNGDGSRNVQHPTEPDLAGRTVFLDIDENGVLDPSFEPHTTTDASGNYAFNDLVAGSYRVRDVLPAGWASTNPSAGFFDVTVGMNQTITRSFGTTFADPDDAITEVDHIPANQISVGKSVNFSIANVTDVDLVRFTATKGQRIGFDIDRAAGSKLNSFLRLFDAVGNPLAGNDDSAAPGESKSSDSYLTFTFNTAGTYYIGVSNNANRVYNAFNGTGDNNAGSTGAYKLSLVNLPSGSASRAGGMSYTQNRSRKSPRDSETC